MKQCEREMNLLSVKNICVFPFLNHRSRITVHFQNWPCVSREYTFVDLHPCDNDRLPDHQYFGVLTLAHTLSYALHTCARASTHTHTYTAVLLPETALQCIILKNDRRELKKSKLVYLLTGSVSVWFRICQGLCLPIPFQEGQKLSSHGD